MFLRRPNEADNVGVRQELLVVASFGDRLHVVDIAAQAGKILARP